jgi:hypothetical protein
LTGRELADRVDRLRNETTTLFWDDVVGEDLTDEDVARLWLSATAYQTAVNQAVKLAADEWVRRFSDSNRSVEVDGYLIFASKKSTSEKCIDTDGFLSWLAQNPLMIPAVLNPNNVKFGSLPPAVRSTFFEKRDVFKPDMTAVAVPVEVLEQNKAKKEARGE